MTGSAAVVAAVVVAIGAIVGGITYWQHHETRRALEHAGAMPTHLPAGT